MKKKLAMVELLLELRAARVFVWLLAIALVNILGGVIAATNIVVVAKQFKLMEIIIIISGIALVVCLTAWCVDFENVDMKRTSLLSRSGLSEKEKYIAELAANIITFAACYIVFALVVALAYCIAVRLRFGADTMIQVMVMHNKSVLFGELFPIYQPLVLLRNVLLILCFGQLSAFAATALQKGNAIYGVCIIPLISFGFVSRRFIYDGYYEITMVAYLCLLTVITFISVCKTVEWCKKDGYREGEKA